ncbi:hypothetical protein PHMEG_00041540, partial [Phytophthora megakarya]
FSNNLGWWNHKMTINFLQFHFSNRQNMSEPILLLLDDFSGHWTDDVIEYAKTINVTLMKVPPNATSVSQPADATWNGPLKGSIAKYVDSVSRGEITSSVAWRCVQIESS